jgi:1,2-diacylglycerol 3-beta-galactosyltransferase
MTRFLKEQAPDMIISVHPLCQHLPLRICNHLHGGQENRSKKMPFVTVVTDLAGGHEMWFHKPVDATFVPSDAFVEISKNARYPQDKVIKHGLPIRPGFRPAVDAAEKDALRNRLGILPGVRTALVVGGGDGVGKISQITKALANELSIDGGGPGQLVVVCGKNEEVRAQLAAEKYPANVSVSALGFVRNMDELMGASDCIITKAGPGTIAEACASGLPIMISGNLPGQEEGNVLYVVKGGFGESSTKPDKIAETVSRWLKDPQLLEDMSKKSLSMGSPHSTRAIATDIGKLLFCDEVGPRLAS